MTPIHWFYTWNSKDEVFHHILKSCFDGSSEFVLHSQQTETTDDRFAVAATFLESQPENELVMISDANIIVDKLSDLYEYLAATATSYDCMIMKHDLINRPLLVRNTQAVRDFIKNLSTTPNPVNLKYTIFDTTLFCDSKNYFLKIMKSMVVYLISVESDQHKAFFEKLNIASGLVDITPLESLIPYDIWNRLIDEHKEANTGLPIMYFNHKSKPWQRNYTFNH